MITASQADTLRALKGRGRTTASEVAAARWPAKCNHGPRRAWPGVVRSQGTVLSRLVRLGFVHHDGTYAPWTITQAGQEALREYDTKV